MSDRNTLLRHARALISGPLRGDIDDKICNAIEMIEFDDAGTSEQREALGYLRGFAEGNGVTVLELIWEARDE